MRHWNFPARTIINDQALVEATVLPAQEFIFDGVRHGAAIFEIWTDEALAELGLAPVDVPEPQPNPRDEIQMRIVGLEALQTPRRMAEAVLTDEGRAWLVDLRSQIDALRAQLV